MTTIDRLFTGTYGKAQIAYNLRFFATERPCFMTILKLEESNLCDYFADEEPFPVIGRLSPKLENGVWTYGEQLFDEPREKQYPPDEIDLAQYLKTPERAIFLAYEDGVPVGRIVLRRNWNRNAFVEDIAVRRAARGRGVGSALLARAGDWAREQGLHGLMLETQDTNLLACRFYQKNGFQLGGVDGCLYRNFEEPYRSETALFWYLPFRSGRY